MSTTSSIKLDTAGKAKRLNYPTTQYEALYAKLFKEYTARTNGKRLIAEWVQRISQQRALGRLIDLGAGDGSITKLLANQFTSVIAVEKNLAFFDDLSSIEGISVISEKMQAVSFQHQADDCILFSYSLNGSSLDDLNSIFRSIFKTSKPSVFLCTDAQFGHWHAFANDVCKLLDIPRYGGAQSDLHRLSDAGIKTILRQRISTRIFGTSPHDLAQTLSCFFVRHQKQYTEELNSITNILRPMLAKSSDPDFNYEFPVVEEIYELTSH